MAIKYKKVIILFCILVFTLGTVVPAQAFQWHTTELHYQLGDLSKPTFINGGGKTVTHILTLQHSSGWAYGDNFFFVDYLNDTEEDGFNDGDIYGEIYLNFSLNKIFGQRIGLGPIKDFGILAGLNAGKDAKVLKYLPGVRASWDIGGFDFLNSDFAFYIDDSRGVAAGGGSERERFILH
jgi:nucleoside-specific outer membrane channel protein Tsx